MSTVAETRPTPNILAVMAEVEAAAEKATEASREIDWGQVVSNGGPPCFHVEDGKFCLRAERWFGHGLHHKFVSLNGLVAANHAPGIIALTRRLLEVVKNIFDWGWELPLDIADLYDALDRDYPGVLGEPGKEGRDA